jgi:hypothetical protein
VADRRDTQTRPPGSGWTLGADGLSRAFWIVMAVLLAGTGIALLASGYYGYGSIIVILAAAAAVNVL